MVKADKGKKKNAKKADKAEEPKNADLAPEETEADKPKEDLENRLLRLQADFDNFRKRVARERGETYARANEDLMTEIIPVIDHLDMAVQAARDHDCPPGLVDGVSLVGDQFKGVLAKFGLEPIDAKGKEFDPNEHEAILHLPSEDVAENMVVEQTRLGYKLKGRILRAAQVVVSSGKAETEG